MAKRTYDQKRQARWDRHQKEAHLETTRLLQEMQNQERLTIVAVNMMEEVLPDVVSDGISYITRRR